MGAVLLAAGALAACSPSSLPSYDLSAPRSAGVRATGLQIIVPEPAAVAPLDGDRIVVRSPTQGLTVLPNAQWSDRLPRLMQSRAIQAFENARLLRAVGRPGDRLVADYGLVSEIRRFEIDAGAREAVVEVSAKLVSERSGRIGAAKVFEGRMPASAMDGASAAAALDQALAIVLRDLVVWVSRSR